MHMYNALYFLPHTCTKKLMSLSGVSSVACSLFHALRGATRPTFKAFWTSEGPKCPQNGLKMGLFHPFVHPKWSRMRSGKMRF